MLLKWTNVQNFAMQLPKPTPPLFEQFSGDAAAFPAAYLILHDPASKAGIESAEGCEAKSNKKVGKT